MTILDARKARSHDGGPSFSLDNRLTRLVWALVWFTCARWTPRPFAPWRRFLLRTFGAHLGARSDVRGSARVWLPANLSLAPDAVLGPGVNCYNQGRITVGARTIVSQGVHLCASTHDVNDPHFQLVVRPIVIGADVWIAAEAFVGPGVHVGDGVVLGARSAAFGDLAEGMIYRGNPASLVRARCLAGKSITHD